MLWEAELGSDHCREQEGGERLLKLQQPLSSNSILAAGGKRSQGAGAGRQHLAFISYLVLNLTKRYLPSPVPRHFPDSLCLCVTEVHSTHDCLHDKKALALFCFTESNPLCPRLAAAWLAPGRAPSRAPGRARRQPHGAGSGAGTEAGPGAEERERSGNGNRSWSGAGTGTEAGAERGSPGGRSPQEGTWPAPGPAVTASTARGQRERHHSAALLQPVV